MTEAKQAGGDKNVLVHGAGTAQLALAAGVRDELDLHVITVLFGQGRHLFEGLARADQAAAHRILEAKTVSHTCTTGSIADLSIPRPSLSRPMAVSSTRARPYRLGRRASAPL
jgi:hypothetical protein